MNESRANRSRALRSRWPVVRGGATRLWVAGIGIGLGAGLLARAQPPPAELAFFEKRVRPVLVEACYKCHSQSAGKHKAGLNVDSRGALLAGGDTGPAVVPGRPDESLLITAVAYQDAELQMPPDGRLPDEAIADLREWIRRGAVWPGADGEVDPLPARREFQITEADRAHWAFQPISQPEPPAVERADWVRNPVDAFVAARLEARGLDPAAPAPPLTLLRRATYDLTGLPPTPEETDAFLRDPSPEAYEALVDRLLASPAYGEKWGRHWLDLVRFAESNSYERDNPKPNAWRFRDYVIRAFNEDKPFDRFVREQLAGDELPDGGADGIVATGYYRLGIWDDEPTDREQARLDGLDDIITTTAQTFLGVTLDCARCHEHKIDPFPQADYYRLLAFFDNINHYRNGGPTDEATIFPEPGSRERYEEQLRIRERRREELRDEISEVEDRFRILYLADQGLEETSGDLAGLIAQHGPRLLGEMPAGAYAERRASLKALEAETVPVEKALCVTEAGRLPRAVHIRIRGNAHVEGDLVEPGFPEVLGFAPPVIPPAPEGARTTGRRSVLADWIVDPANPLTARVIVNRVWQHHFGRGIVRTPNDFGRQGSRPTHPQLLDWLASRFVRDGWKLKDLHRLIMTSNAYRMSSTGNTRGREVDPENELFWRFNPRRLTAEEIRDTLLAASGELNRKMFGPGIYVEIPPEILAGQSRPGHGWGESLPDERNRRSVYIHVKRSLLAPILESFDLPETDRTTPVRFSSVQPTQALGMLNGRFVRDQAARLAARVRQEIPDDPEQQIRRALRLTTCRPPAAREVRRGRELVEALQAGDALSPERAFESFCLLALNLNETLYLD